MVKTSGSRPTAMPLSERYRTPTPDEAALRLLIDDPEELPAWKLDPKSPTPLLAGMGPRPRPPRASRTKTLLNALLGRLTPHLFVGCLVAALVCVLFGFDVTSFAGVQEIPSFEREFGTPIGKDGAYELSASRVSFISSVAFAGKLLGSLAAPILIERLGHKQGFWALSLISTIGIIIECTSHSVAQFVLGRIIVYFSVGLAEVVAPTYQSEIVPAGQRGAVVSSVQLSISTGQIIAAGVNRVYSKETVPGGWIRPVAFQAVFPVLVFIGTFFMTDAPRWLLSRHRKEDAIKSLERLRPKTDVIAGSCREEADAIQEALHNKMEKGPWMDLLRGTNLRRTMIAVVLFTFQQFTGQTFVSSYAPRFYTQEGRGAYAFDYQIASTALGLIGCVVGLVLADRIGRRDILLWGALSQALWLFLLSGLGTIKNPSDAVTNGIVACVMLFATSYVGTWGPIVYVVSSEVGTGALREKTMAIGAAFNVISAWVVAFSIPYLLNDIGSSIGWVFGGMAILAAIFTWFCVPELKNRSLEEVDEMFAKRLPARKFAGMQILGPSRRVSELQSHSPHDRRGSERRKSTTSGYSYHADEEL